MRIDSKSKRIREKNNPFSSLLATLVVYETFHIVIGLLRIPFQAEKGERGRRAAVHYK